MPYTIEYFSLIDGTQPVNDWLDSLDVRTNANLFDKITRLHQYGLVLLQTNMMKRLEGYGQNFYELRYDKYRIALFHETEIDTFILLHGFKKERQREVHEIAVAYSRLKLYLERKE